MPELVRIELNGTPVDVPATASVAVCVFLSGRSAFRTSVTGEPRSALCGMGICFECRLTIDGVPHRRSCQIGVRAGMRIETT
jgi:hypothetical protein